jgi:hypothetical protein
LLLKVCIEFVGGDSGAVSLQLVFVDVDKDCRDIFEKLVDPSEVQQRLVDGL